MPSCTIWQGRLLHTVMVQAWGLCLSTLLLIRKSHRVARAVRPVKRDGIRHMEALAQCLTSSIIVREPVTLFNVAWHVCPLVRRCSDAGSARDHDRVRCCSGERTPTGKMHSDDRREHSPPARSREVLGRGGGEDLRLLERGRFVIRHGFGFSSLP